MVKLDGPTTDALNALPIEHRRYARAYTELHPALSSMMRQPNRIAWRQVLSVLDSTFEDLHAVANADEEDNTYPSALLLSVDSVLDAAETNNFTFSDLPGWRLPSGTIEFLKEQEGVPDLGFKYSPIGWIQRVTKVFTRNHKARDADDKTTQSKSRVASASSGKSTVAASDDEGQNVEDNDDELLEEGPPDDDEEEIDQEEAIVPQKVRRKEKPRTSTRTTRSQVIPEVVIPRPGQLLTQAMASSISSSSKKRPRGDSLSTVVSIPQAKKIKSEGGKRSSTDSKPASKPAPKPSASKIVYLDPPEDLYLTMTRSQFAESSERAPRARAEASSASKRPKEPPLPDVDHLFKADCGLTFVERFVNALKARGETVPEGISMDFCDSRASLFLPSGLRATIESLANGISAVQRPSRGQLGTCCFSCINNPHKCGFPTGKAHKCPRCKELGTPCSFNVYPEANANMKNWAALMGMSSPLGFQQQLAKIFDNRATIGNLIRVQDILESQIESCLSNDQVYTAQLHASGRDARDVFHIINESNPRLVDDPLFVSVLAGMFGWETEGLETGFRVVRNKDGSLSFVDESGNVVFTDNDPSFPSGAPPRDKSSTNPVAGPSNSKDDSEEVSEAATDLASEYRLPGAPSEEASKAD
ncbi:hypothetical protein L218DRAFT_990918, partial [Marasmius fiardii PR-910]